MSRTRMMPFPTERMNSSHLPPGSERSIARQSGRSKSNGPLFRTRDTLAIAPHSFIYSTCTSTLLDSGLFRTSVSFTSFYTSPYEETFHIAHPLRSLESWKGLIFPLSLYDLQFPPLGHSIQFRDRNSQLYLRCDPFAEIEEMAFFLMLVGDVYLWQFFMFRFGDLSDETRFSCYNCGNSGS